MQLVYKLEINAASHCPEGVNDKLCNIHEPYLRKQHIFNERNRDGKVNENFRVL
jgi:hypothetical protein